MQINKKLEYLAEQAKLRLSYRAQGLSEEHIDQLLVDKPNPKDPAPPVDSKNFFCTSRYNQPRYYDLLPNGDILLYGKSEFVRQGEGMFDFEGGPFIMAGDPLMSDSGTIGIVQDVVYYDEGPEGFTCCRITLK
jgi:hypothetical protein